MRNTNKNIFIGLINTAGISARLKEGFDRLGVKADFYQFTSHPYQYGSNKFLKYSSNPIIRYVQKFSVMVKLLVKYKFFIFLSPYTLLSDFKDIRLFKLFRKKTMIIFTGCDVRMPEKVAEYRWNPCVNCPQEYKDYVSCIIPTKKNVIRQVEKLFNIIVCPEEGAGYLTKDYIRAYFPINLNEYKAPYIKPERNSKLRILHAPSNFSVKGTQYIIEAIEALKSKYDFQFSVLSNVSVKDVYESILSSDLIIDQMLVGFYGLFSIEAMALSKPVICYIRSDIWKNIKHDCPIYNASPDNLGKVLENILKNPEQLNEQASLARQYVERYHDSEKIAQYYFQILDSCR